MKHKHAQAKVGMSLHIEEGLWRQEQEFALKYALKNGKASLDGKTSYTDEDVNGECLMGDDVFFTSEPVRVVFDDEHKHVDISDSGLYIRDEFGEIVMWSMDELKEDETTLLAALNAMRVFYANGPDTLRNIVGLHQNVPRETSDPSIPGNARTVTIGTNIVDYWWNDGASLIVDEADVEFLTEVLSEGFREGKLEQRDYETERTHEGRWKRRL